MNGFKVWPHLTVIALLGALLGGAAVALWSKHETTVQAQALPNAARIERVDGEVGLDRSLDNNGAPTQWLAATPNLPITVGDRIYVRDNSRASLAFTGRDFARLEPRSSLDVLSLSNRRTQLALRDGSCVFNVGALAPNELFEVATPLGAVDFDQPGLYQVGINDNGNTVISVLSGLAQVVGLGGSGQISKGEVLTLVGQTASDVVLSRLEPTYAGNLVNDYYSYQYPTLYDGRYTSYDAYLNDPYYYDPYNRYVSYQYVPDIIPGVEDLDAYGDWQDVSGYGHCWHPRVDAAWVPYQQGYWTTDEPYGLTWVSTEPWGYAPYHYGRWAYLSNQWFWVPDSINTQPAYAPALVAFVPLPQANEVGWVPLAPSDPYLPRYYSADWQPHYLTQTQIVQPQVVNLNVPGAVTVVPVQEFNRVIDRRVITRVDQQMIANVRPVLDPLAVAPLRQAAMQTSAARHRIDVPPEIARRLDNTQVITSTAPVAPPFRRDLPQALRVEAVPAKQRAQQLQFRDERQANVAQQPVVDQARAQQMAALATQAARGDRGARRQLEQLQRQQQQTERNVARQQTLVQQNNAAAQAANARAQQSAAQQAQGERVGQQLRAQREAERQQAFAAQQQQRAAMQQQIEAHREANRAAAMQAHQAAVQRAQQEHRHMQQTPAPLAVRPQVQAQPRPQVIRPPVSAQPRPAPPQRAQPQREERRPPAPQAQPQPQMERKQGPPPQAAKPQPAARQQNGGGKKHP
jgi:FecR protein